MPDRPVLVVMLGGIAGGRIATLMRRALEASALDTIDGALASGVSSARCCSLTRARGPPAGGRDAGPGPRPGRRQLPLRRRSRRGYRAAPHRAAALRRARAARRCSVTASSLRSRKRSPATRLRASRTISSPRTSSRSRPPRSSPASTRCPAPTTPFHGAEARSTGWRWRSCRAASPRSSTSTPRSTSPRSRSARAGPRLGQLLEALGARH